MAAMVVYSHVNFTGDESEVQTHDRPHVGGFWNDKISSIRIMGGRWQFFEHANFGGNSWELGIGEYPNVANVGIPHDSISSFRVIEG
ncbi:beta/gamma crystallin-related protein [Scytonema sp. PCC 10023]|uniref:beta/gamma crystallin-related protein n=1 Tax=Scytonema sp. PCC 10023 TaxID=1680591 RepID=UPI0039C5C581